MPRLLLLLLLGCAGGSDSPPPDPPDCTLCPDATFCVIHEDADGTPSYHTCAPFPEDCPTALDCADNTCRAAAHTACDPGTRARACEPLLLTCTGDL